MACFSSHVQDLSVGLSTNHNEEQLSTSEVAPLLEESMPELVVLPPSPPALESKKNFVSGSFSRLVPTDGGKLHTM